MSTIKKVNAAAIGGPMAIVFTWSFTIVTLIEVPAEVGAALGAIFTFIVSVAIPDDKEE